MITMPTTTAQIPEIVSGKAKERNKPAKANVEKILVALLGLAIPPNPKVAMAAKRITAPRPTQHKPTNLQRSRCKSLFSCFSGVANVES